MAEFSMEVSVPASDIIDKVRRNLAVIGKRARDGKGSNIFSEVTVSGVEELLFADLLTFGGESIVAELTDVASVYFSDDDGSLSFRITSTRWNDTVEEKDLSPALDGAIRGYLYNFVVARYLDGVGMRFGVTYDGHCQMLMSKVKTLAFMKRAVEIEGRSYADVKMSE